MQFFLDSASVDEITHALDMWAIDGVTTDPRLIQAGGKPFLAVVEEIGALLAGTQKTVSVAVNPHFDRWEEMAQEGHKLFALCPDNLVIKVPATEAGFKACAVLTERGVRVNVAACFSAMQALQAMRMGAYYVSPCIGEKEANAEETAHFVKEVVAIRDNYDFDTEIIVTAVRSARQIVEAALVGADIVTAGFGVYQDGFDHPYTHAGLDKFQQFWDQTQHE
ncbi:MAG: transaldolase [Anaerolineae bacterium]|nr:transaldolase [Anaerolineae bacterium]